MNHGWRHYVGRVIGFVDSRILGGMLWFQTMAKEWLSIEQRSIEWLMLAAYVVLAVYQVSIWPWRWYYGFYLLWLLWIVVWLCFEIQSCRACRLYKMLTIRWIFRRFSLDIFTVALFGVDWFAGAHHIKHWGWSSDCANVFFTLLQYSTSLPSCGEPGGRRKLSRAKLKELLGGIVDWLPDPEGNRV